jgi:aspartate aminotransferase-like enzyme
MLWIPGPTEVRAAILEELTRPMIGHRSAAMVELLERIDPGLRLAFGLTPDSPSVVAVGTHSATAMMEGSLIGAGPRVLCVVNGAFSKRWRDVAHTLKKDVHTVEVEWGDAVTGERLEREVDAAGPFDAVTLVVNETSTGVHTPLAPVAAALRAHGRPLLLIDVVSAIAGTAIDFEEHGVDFALAGVNKALALPPGICVMAASERYLAGARERERRAWYLDPVRTIEGHLARKTPTTPCVPLYAALARQLEDITSAGWEERFAKHDRMRERTLTWAEGRGFPPFPARELSSPTVSCLRSGELDVAGFIADLKAAGHEIGGGYGPLKGETFRIGHMGDHDEEGLEALLGAADRVLG